MVTINGHLVNGKYEPVSAIPEPNSGICFSVNKYYVFNDEVEFQAFVDSLNINVDVG
jgi:hypothetical protein